MEKKQKVILSLKSSTLNHICFKAQGKGILPVQEIINTLEEKYAVKENIKPEDGWLDWILFAKDAPDFRPSP